MNRRSFLKLTGVTLVALSGGAIYRALDQGVFAVGQGVAYQPWVDWESQSEKGNLALVKAAILAANPHNTQPWIFRVSDNQIDLYADLKRSLGTVDPFHREMYLSLGCALENLSLAAQANGQNAKIQLMPSDDSTWVARVLLSTGNTYLSELYRAIPQRHTNRAAYANQELSTNVFEVMQALITPQERTRLLWIKSEQAKQLGVLTYAATEAFAADAEQVADSSRWFRHDWDDIQELGDGITLDAQANPPFMTALGKLLPPLSDADNNKFWLKATHTQIENSAALGILTVPNALDNVARLQAGMTYQRMHLWAVTQGLAMQPMCQLIERIERETSLGMESRFSRDLDELVEASNGQSILLFRIGYPNIEPLPSPRRAAEQVIT